MSNRKHSFLLLAALLAVVPTATLFSRAAHAQTADGMDAPPPPSDEYDDDDDDVAEPAPVAEAQPPPRPPDQRMFDQELSPYGQWVITPEYGRVWVPAAASVRPDWQPYTDGHWAYTPYGWSFVSGVPWGSVFHYGRWGWGAGIGWYWVPGYVWAPAWVSWRYSEGHVAWAPYAPPGYRYGHRWRGWVAVERTHFRQPIAHYAIPYAQSRVIVRNARPVESIRGVPQHGHYYGPPRAFVTQRAAPHVIVTQGPAQRVVATQRAAPHVIVAQRPAPHVFVTQTAAPRVIVTQRPAQRVVVNQRAAPHVVVNRRASEGGTHRQ